MIEEPNDTTCLVCGHTPTSTGFICRPCYNERIGTTHPNWTNPDYWNGIKDQTRIANAAEARYELKTQRRNRFTRMEIPV